MCVRFPEVQQSHHKPLGLRRGPELQKVPGKHSAWAALPGSLTSCVSPTAMLDEDEEERVDETALRQLTEMGFPESRAVKALRLNQYVGPPGAGGGPAPRDLPVPTP